MKRHTHREGWGETALHDDTESRPPAEHHSRAPQQSTTTQHNCPVYPTGASGTHQTQFRLTLPFLVLPSQLSSPLSSAGCPSSALRKKKGKTGRVENVFSPRGVPSGETALRAAAGLKRRIWRFRTAGFGEDALTGWASRRLDEGPCKSVFCTEKNGQEKKTTK